MTKPSPSGCGGPVIPGDHSLKNLIKKIGKGPKLSRDLARDEARDALAQILDGTAEPQQTGAFLVALRMKGESADELAGLTDALRERSIFLEHDFKALLELAPAHDGKTKTLVLSPFVAMIVAQAGIPIVVTGAADVPTKKGITPRSVFQELKIPVDDDAASVMLALKTRGFAYYDASRFCPALEDLKRVRDSLGLRTPLNSVEKIIRPTKATHLCTGVYHGPYLKEIAGACLALGYPHALCLQATEASTDLPLKKRTLYRRGENGSLSEQSEIDPLTFGLTCEGNAEFTGDVSAAANVAAVREALREREGPVYDSIVYNSGVQLWFAGEAPDVATGMKSAEKIIRNGLF